MNSKEVSSHKGHSLRMCEVKGSRGKTLESLNPKILDPFEISSVSLWQRED